MIARNEPMVYIRWTEDGETHCIGSFYSIAPDGDGRCAGQNWTAYQVYTKGLKFERVIVPTKYHTITA